MGPKLYLDLVTENLKIPIMVWAESNMEIPVLVKYKALAHYMKSVIDSLETVIPRITMA
jgi:hypothetical protein